MDDSNLKKILTALQALITHPGESLSWIRRGHLLKDRAVIDQSYWFRGDATRISLKEIFPKSKEIEIQLPQAFDRTFGTSITAEEACNIAALVKSHGGKKVLEIGTFDGNTALLIATNLPSDGTVVTVDLPPDFDPKKDQSTLAHAGVKINLTPRDLVAGQYQGHAQASKISQVYGDSATLDWNTFGGPFDLIFIDGCHKAEYVRTDTENALKQLAQGGVILWHDYGVIPDVTVVVDEFAKNIKNLTVRVLEGTRIAIGTRT